MNLRSFCFSVVIANFCFQWVALGQETKSPNDLFNDRIMPIFRSPNPSSCVQCHLSSVELKDYILPSHEATFVSLRDQGLIDLANPKSSKILKWIDMGKKDLDTHAKRIHEAMRKAEYEAFAEWIVASCADQKLVKLPKSKNENQSGPTASKEIIRHARKSRIMDSFVRNIWSQRMRCFPCHTENEIGPRQKGAKDKFDNWYSQYGDQMLIFKKTPEATLRYLIEESKKDLDSLPLLNLSEPSKSLLVLKPMSKVPPKTGERRVPTYTEPIYHMGGLKIHKNDHTHKAFVKWIQDYAAVTNREYKTAKELPADNWFPTQRILRLKDVPQALKVGTTVQMFVYSLDSKSNTGDKKLVAFTQGTVTPKRLVNGALILLAPGDHLEFKKWRANRNRLPPGEYVVKLVADQRNELQADPTILLNTKAAFAEVILKHANWKTGFPNAEWISAQESTE